MCPICHTENVPGTRLCKVCSFPLFEVASAPAQTVVAPSVINSALPPPITSLDPAAYLNHLQIQPVPLKPPQPPHEGQGPVAPVAAFDLATFTGSRLIIGRDPAANLSLPHPAVSWQHARIDRVGRQWCLSDLKSRNRTFLTRGHQSIPLPGPVMLEVGDKIGIHPYTLVFTGASLNPTYEIELIADSLSQTIVERYWQDYNLQSRSKVLLSNISMAIRPREFIGVLGGSGAGKSTLLRALSGYTQNEGRVYFNGYDYYANFDAFRGQVGFVPQSDIIHGELTVQAALTFAAELRLGNHYQIDEIHKKVGEVLERLELEPQRATLIHNLSGGQRKRVSIAVELLTSPPLFFLDEPTSGLDPGLEADMMRLFRTLSDDGHTVILVTHSVVNISLCDKIAVLGVGGVLVYYGPPGQTGVDRSATALRHFGIKEHVDIYRVVQPQIKKLGQYVYLDLPAECENREVQRLAAEVNREGHVEANRLLLNWSERLRGYYQQTLEYRSGVELPVQQHRLQVAPAPVAPVAEKTRVNPARTGLSFKQSSILIRRYIALIRSDWRALGLLMLQAPIIGVILAFSVPKNVLESSVGWLDTQRFLAMMACSVLWFGIINSGREVVKELPIYKRERFVNLNIFAYLLSKFTVLFFVCAAQCALLLVTVSLVGVRIGGRGVFMPVWFEFYIDLLLTALVGLALGLLASCTVSTSEQVISAIPIVLLPQIILNPGLFPNPEGLLKLIVNCLVSSKWGLVALGDSSNINAKAPFAAVEIYTGDAKGIIMAWLVLLLMMVICLALAYFQLRYKDEQPRNRV